VAKKTNKETAMKYYILFLLSMMLVMGCGGDSVEKTKPVTENIFHDEVLRTIYTLQNQRDVEGLKVYLGNKESRYREASALAFASVQSPDAVDALAKLLSDEQETVRSAAAYALGQTRDKKAEPLLMDAFGREQSAVVKRDLLEALGKCGTTKGLEFITGLTPKGTNETVLIVEGQAWGLYRFGLQNVVSPQGTALAVKLIAVDKPDKVRFVAAHYLARTRNLDLKEHYLELIKAFDGKKDLDTRMALALAMGKAAVPVVLERLTWVLDKENDYRVKVNALRALGRFEYAQVKELFFKNLSHKNVNIAVAASEYFLNNGKGEDALHYFETAKQRCNWRCRANMLQAALKFMPETDRKNRKRVSDWTQAVFKKSANSYEQAWLLSALAWDLDNAGFVNWMTFDNTGKKTVISTYGMSSLVRMFRTAKNSGKVDEKTVQMFAEFFKKGVLSGDTSMITMSAGIMREPKMGFKEVYKDTAFLTAALNKCKLPGELEAWESLKRTIDYFAGKKETEPEAPKQNRAIDWELVKTIDPDKKVKIKTSKGDIVIRLLVDQSPGSVGNFLELIREDFYKQSVIHRVVPNFVIQNGCPRGDGWGGPTYAIGSEFGPLYYDEGSVGMASAGKDTEGSQWFITHSPTPHLDGRYTIFAQVVSGMEVVHKLEVGDRIQGFEEL
jgi:cyclophilin family peptidyl-prolyl cis-trans isomerase/HEAT repeat protein